MARRIRVLLIAAAAVILIAAPSALDDFYLSILSQMLIFAVFAMSLDLLQGYAGLPSLGHAAFFGVAAYAVALASLKGGLDNLWLGLLLGVVTGAAVAAVFGILALRTRGGSFLMTTLALAQVLWALAFGWDSLTGGYNGLPGLPRPAWGLPWSLADSTVFYFLVLGMAITAGLLMYRVVRSPFGLALVGTRESDSRMAMLGHNVWLYRFIAFVMAGTFAALAGTLFVYEQGYVNPDSLGVVLSARVFLMVILGGPGTLLGPALGAGTIVLLQNVVTQYTGRWQMIVGAIFVLVALFAPRGLYRRIRGGRQDHFAQRVPFARGDLEAFRVPERSEERKPPRRSRGT